MPKYDNHHIIYADGEKNTDEWVISLRKYLHKTISVIQHTKATQEFYADLTNFMHSVVAEWNRVRSELDKEEYNEK